MSCPIVLAGILEGCKDNVGGIKEVYIIDIAQIQSKTLTASVITALTLVGATKFKTYKFKKQTAAMTSTATITDATDNIFYTTDLALKFNKQDTAKGIEMANLVKGNLAAIALDNNGKYWFLGYDNEASVSASVAMTGTAFGDASGYELTIQDISKQLPYEVSGAIIAAIIS